MLVTRRLGEENTPDVITNKIHRKVRELAEMCGIDLASEQKEEQPEAAPAPVAEPTAEPEVQEAPAQHLPEEDYDAEETWQHDNGEEIKEVFELNYEEPQHNAPTPPPFKVATETPETPAVAVAPAEPDIEPLPDPDPDVVPEAEDGPDIEVEFIEADDDTVPEPEDEMPIPPVPTEFPEEESPAAPLRVDEKLQRHLSKDIRKAISLNDRFRFQRELFAGSANAMDTAIEHIEVMTSYGNAELYFYSQLNWDRENEVVKDFMAIVRNHFQK